MVQARGPLSWKTVLRKRVSVKYLSVTEPLTVMGQCIPYWVTTLIGALSGFEVRWVPPLLWYCVSGDPGIAVGCCAHEWLTRRCQCVFGDYIQRFGNLGGTRLRSSGARNLCNTWRHAIEFPACDPRQAD